MIGADRAESPDVHGPDTTRDDTRVVVAWDVRTCRRLRTVGLSELGSDFDVVVVDRRGCETTPCEPGVLFVGGHRVLVVPDRRDGAPLVEVWIAGTRERFGEVVLTLQRTVALDASIDTAFESAPGNRRPYPGDDVSPDGGSRSPPVEPELLAFDTPDMALAVGGFAGAVEPLE